MSDETEDDVKRRHRRLKPQDDAGAAATESGASDLPAPSYVDETGTADLGVAEPTVPVPLRGHQAAE